jgi:arginine N-succinyltransferase
MVDIFDAGPCVSCRLDDVRTVRESRRATVAAIADGPTDAPAYMVGTRGRDFRAACGPATLSGDGAGVTIARDVAAVLGVDVGSVVRVAPLRPTAPEVATADLEYTGHGREGSD